MRSRLSILGLYNYRPDVFDDMAVPSGLVKTRIIDTILMDCAEIGLTYANPDIMKRMIKTWSYNKLPAWERILTALEEQYNPLHNYDRHETWTDEGSASASASGSNSTKVAGFNSGTSMADRDTNTQSTSSSSNSTGEHTGHTYGNIGVTTSAQMLQGEIDVRTANDMYDIILQSFKNQFCVQVY